MSINPLPTKCIRYLAYMCNELRPADIVPYYKLQYFKLKRLNWTSWIHETTDISSLTFLWHNWQAHVEDKAIYRQQQCCIRFPIGENKCKDAQL